MEFGVLGPLEVGHQGQVLCVGTPRDRAVLAVLLARANDLVSVVQLVDELWPESPPTQARALVRGHVSRVRTALRTGRGGQVPADRLITRKPGYLMRVEDGELDVHRFERLIADARAAGRAGHPDRSLTLFRQAHQVWRGAPFADLPATPAIAAAANRLSELRLATFEELYDAALASGQDAEIVAELAELLVRHPLRERLVGQLMRALHRSGRSADALTTYEQLKQRLADELGIDPGDQLQQLHLAILRNEPDPTQARHDRSARVEPSRPAAPRQLRAVSAVPRQLPAVSAVFTGRVGELAELCRPSDVSAVVISAVDGMAGVGKTALAVQAAHRLAPRYPDGQIFLDLHGFADGAAPVDPADALVRVLRALGVPSGLIPAHLDDLSALLRTTLAGRRVLLVLDNAADELQVRPLLPGTPGCMVLVTSRRRLADLDEAHVMAVDVLPAAVAVDLFTRAAGLPPSTGPLSHVVAEIVELCGRLPLAIRIAAARLRAHPAWTPPDLLERLGDQRQRLAQLRAGQRSVNCALDLSYRHLTADQQHIYRLLGLHPGLEIDIHAAAALGGASLPLVRQVLDDLLQVHLLAEPTPGRYQFHDLVRAHAEQACQEHEPEATRRAALTRLLDHYAHNALVATDLLYPHEGSRLPHVSAGETPRLAVADADEAGAWLDTELSNLVAAAEFAAEHGRPGHTIQLSMALFHHLRVRGHLTYAEALHTRALQAARLTDDLIGLLRAMISLADVHRLAGRLGTAIALFEEAAELAREVEDPAGELIALRGLGRVYYFQGRHKRAIDCYRHAVTIARRAGDRLGEQDPLLGLGLIHCQLGEHDRATDSFSQACATAHEFGDRLGELRALVGLGHVRSFQGRYDHATDSFRTALAIARDIGDRICEQYVLYGLGLVDRILGRHPDATEHCEQALVIAREVGDRIGEAQALCSLGHIRRVTGRPEQALTLHRQALDLSHDETLETHRDSPIQARAHNGLAQAHHALGQRDQARHHWQAALTILINLGLANDGEATVDEIRAQVASLDRYHS